MTKPGHQIDGQFMGTTLFEHGIGKQAVVLNANHYVTLAGTGSGKSVTSIYPNLLMGRYSGMIVISPKPEHVHLAAFRHADPRNFEFGREMPEGATSRGLNPEAARRTRFHMPRSRSFVLDPGGQTGGRTHSYTFLSDIDVKKPGATGRLLATAAGTFPDNPQANDPWFVNGPRTAFAASCGHLLSGGYPPYRQTLPTALRRLMGIDPETGKASPDNQTAYLEEMMTNPNLGGFIQTVATSVYQLGEKAYGSLNSELQTKGVWMLDPTMDDVLGRPSDLRLEEVGVDDWPVTLFAVPPRGEEASYAWLRTLFELASLVFQQRPGAPKKPVLIVADELAIWGKQVGKVKELLAILRDKNVKLWLYAQNYPQLVGMYGKDGAEQVLSSCVLQVFGCNDTGTRKMIRERLGKSDVKRCRDGNLSERTADLVSDDAIDRELRVDSSLQYVISPHLPPMRLDRMAHKTLTTKENAKFLGLPLCGHFED